MRSAESRGYAKFREVARSPLQIFSAPVEKDLWPTGRLPALSFARRSC